MSVQFGRWSFEGQELPEDRLEKINSFLAPYGPDSREAYSGVGIKILYRAFHTTKESRRETQPHISTSGAVITWDGRLDNRAELISELRGAVTIGSTDVEIVAAAYEKWGVSCFARLIGDWALTVWNPRDHALVLAKDPIGTHHLYYSFENNQVTWSTILDPLVLFANKTFTICEEYVAGWFAYLPAAHLTPYVGIDAVPPSSFVLLRPGRRVISKYWDFDPNKKIRYHRDAEYEEHFRAVFAAAIQRRLRSDRPVLAELSGGMDSSAIVCMADTVIARGDAETPRLDTISWCDDSDPVWSEERLYFTKVEQRRGRAGFHLDMTMTEEMDGNGVDSNKHFCFGFEREGLVAAQEFDRNWPDISDNFMAYLQSQGYRVILSGIGGELPTGGFAPTPTPELQNLLARARFFTLARQLRSWATKMRKPQLPLLWEAIRGFFTYSLTFPNAPKDVRPASWFQPSFVSRNQAALSGYRSRVNLFGPSPGFQTDIHMLNYQIMVMAYFGGLRFRLGTLREERYPYLDRDVLEFAYAIPREQVVGIGKRRFLMKRALLGIVPDELLNRKPRAMVTPEATKYTSTGWPSVADLGEHLMSSSIGVDQNRFFDMLRKAERGEEVPVEVLKRALFLEAWLRHLANCGILTKSMETRRSKYLFSVGGQVVRASAPRKSSVS